MDALVRAAMSDPWAALDAVLDGPLHPGGHEATTRLLDRSGVDADTRLLDVGCGAGGAVALATDRGATAIGLDRDPGSDTAVRGDLCLLPVRDGSVDVVLAECSLCLAADLDSALAEARRVLRSDGRLALSDVVVDGDVPDLPSAVTAPLCLDESRERGRLVDAVERAGFDAGDVRVHREDLLAMRAELARKIDYEAALEAMGRPELADGIRELEAAVEDGRVGYVSLVARPE